MLKNLLCELINRMVKIIKIILLVLAVFTLSFSIGVEIVKGIGQEQTGWDVDYDTNPSNNNDAILYNGENRLGYMSLATKSNGYPGIAYTKGNATNNDLAYIECTSGDCASGSGVGSAQWSGETVIDNSASKSGDTPVIDFDINNNATIVYARSTDLRMAKYTPGSGSGCLAAIGLVLM
jgi:hypothetical protein